jgi:threonyl-tRNA synthetase
MPTITLPDGSKKSFPGPVSARQVAEAIGPRLAQAALGAKIDGKLSDLATVINGDCSVSIVTAKNRDGTPDPDALLLIRHSAAHVMAEAIQRIVPGAQLVYGPPLATGFYYDIAFPADRSLSAGDFPVIESEMKKIIAEDRPFTRYEVAGLKGVEKLEREGNKYKLDNAKRAFEAFEEEATTDAVVGRVFFSKVLEPGFPVPQDATLSFYATGTPGKNWEDLCRGPHVPSTGRIGAAKVMSIASSYWHGDENSDRLTRVYGTAFPEQKQLDEYLKQIEQARERDHRVIGKKLRLFHIDEMVGQGLILWTPRGAIIRQELQTFISAELRKQGYFQVFSPTIGKLDLYRTSGHFPYYKDSQYPPIIERESLALLAGEGCSCAQLSNRLDKGDIDGYLLRPMNCPHHIKIFDSQPHSYRDMPVRLAEFGTVYRWEQSGELNGMTRVRGFTQDDAHLFCTPEQVGPELLGCLELVKIIFRTLAIKEYRVRVGLRAVDSSKYIGSPDNWDKAEAACLQAAASLGVPFSRDPGEAAFYGPKIDFVVKDVIGREWQLGTVQVDYNLPERFKLSYIGPDNHEHRPVMIHRAPFGSMERFVGVLIEHFAGAFPTWLSPEQVRVLPISEKTNEYASKVAAELRARVVRVAADLSGDRIQAKVKAAAEEKVPYMLVVGPRDAEQNAVSVRVRGVEKDLGAMPLERFVDAIASEIGERRAELSVRP